MLDQILSFLTSGLNACFSWFSSILESIPGSWGLILSMITIGLVARFLLAPLFGFSLGMASDRASSSARPKPRDKSLKGGT